ncbi:MAG: protein kinase [Gammaproteobacteria bacterium]|nr:protein kinase [Gammaproteobacteria bacterium]
MNFNRIIQIFLGYLTVSLFLKNAISQSRASLGFAMSIANDEKLSFNDQLMEFNIAHHNNLRINEKRQDRRLSNYKQKIPSLKKLTDASNPEFQKFILMPSSNNIFFIKRSAITAHAVDICILSASSNYQSYILQTTASLPETATADFGFLIASNNDLFVIKKSATGTHSTEVHVLSASSIYQSFKLQTGTALHETGDEFEFLLANNNDLFIIKKSGTGTRSTEVHVLSASSNYQRYRLNTGTALKEIEDEFQFSLASSNNDLFVIRKLGTETHSTEIHILSASSNYQRFSLETGTCLSEIKTEAQFLITNSRDLVAIKALSSGSNRAEGYKLFANNVYQQCLSLTLLLPYTVITSRPTLSPTAQPSQPTYQPTLRPTFLPTTQPTFRPTFSPTNATSALNDEVTTDLTYFYLTLFVCLGGVIGLTCLICFYCRKNKSIHTAPYEEREFKKIDKPAPSAPPFSGNQKDIKAVNSTSIPIISWSDLILGKELGRGGFGVVYKALWLKTTSVAVKKLLKALTPDLLEEFKKETEVHIHLRHPNVIMLYGICLPPQQFGMVLEFMANGSLDQVLQRPGECSLSTRLTFALEMVSGLLYLHSKNIVHRDLKSLNVLIDEHMHAKIADFGLAKIRHSTETLTVGPMGTPCWMAPELFDEGACDKTTDIYATGVIFWEIATRKKPYEGKTLAQLIKDLTNGKREKIPAETPQQFAALITRCWAQRAEDRPTIENIVKNMQDIQRTYAGSPH